MMLLLNTLRIITVCLVATVLFATGVLFANAQSADPVASTYAEPEVLGVSVDSSVDAIADSVDGQVLGASVDASIDPVEGESIDGVVLGATTDDPEVSDVVTPSMDPVIEVDSSQLAATVALNVRVSPSSATGRVGVAYPGMLATVIGGPIDFDGQSASR